MAFAGSLGRGAESDYVLGTIFGWDAFDVVRWHAVEAISELFEYEVVLSRKAELGALPIEDLVDRGASFRIAGAARWRTVHGIVAESQLVDATSTMLLYRVVLVPMLWRARHRRRCRSFVDQSLRQIIETVLENRTPRHPAGLRGLSALGAETPQAPGTEPSFASFREPVGSYRWAIGEAERVRAVRAFLVQYNETDFDFVSRLLEAEGLSYYFDHGPSECVLTLTDRPMRDAALPTEQRLELVGAAEGGHADRQEVVRSWRPGRRLRSTAVTLRDYAWRKSTTLLEATACASAADAHDLEHFEFPAADEDEPTRPGAAPARVQLERYRVEEALGRGVSTARSHEPAQRFRLVDRAGLREEEELLLVRAETFAAQLVPESTALDAEPFGFAGSHARRGAFFETRFESIPAAVAFRPARSTPKPRIDGVQTARVTAEELPRLGGTAGPELNSDELGRVRIRFPWDQRPEDGTPSSKWVRVSQPWAGAGFGALLVPRVGHEVLVAFERGDPDRPIVVGRLYNVQSPPPYTEANSTKTTVKSDSVGADGSAADGFNELRFDDRAHEEQIFLHAERNLDEVVRANHTTSVGGDQSNAVGGNQTNTVAGIRKHTVQGGLEQVDVTGTRTTHISGTETHGVDENRGTYIGTQDELHAGSRVTTVGTTDELSVGAKRTVFVTADHDVSTHASYHSQANGNHTFDSTNMYVTQAGAFQVNASTLWLNVGGASLKMGSGIIALDSGGGARVTLCGDMVLVTGGRIISTSGTHSLMSSGGTSIVDGTQVGVTSPAIKLNG